MQTRHLLLFFGVLVLGALAIIPLKLHGQQPEAELDRQAKAVEVSTNWLRNLAAGDVEGTLKYSSIPFAWDDEVLIEQHLVLKDKYQQVLEDKGKRTLTKLQPTLLPGESQILNGCIPLANILVQYEIDGEFVNVCVRPGETFVVTGFQDQVQTKDNH